MKLRNKKTGEIIETDYKLSISIPNGETLYGCQTYDEIKGYNSLANLNEEWEDYEEPKRYWYIEPNGVIARIDEWDCCTDSDIEIMKTFGNYFENKEEAEKAVEKLKAWKRLKDKGFSFKTWGWDNSSDNEYTIYFTLDSKSGDAVDLDLLFGGEE